jgi:hypothetical protein
LLLTAGLDFVAEPAQDNQADPDRARRPAEATQYDGDKRWHRQFRRIFDHC